MNTNPMFILANNVSIESGMVLANGLTYESRIQFFLGAIHYGQEEIVKYMADMDWNNDIIPLLQDICHSLQDYEPHLINWIRTKFLL